MIRVFLLFNLIKIAIKHLNSHTSRVFFAAFVLERGRRNIVFVLERHFLIYFWMGLLGSLEGIEGSSTREFRELLIIITRQSFRQFLCSSNTETEPSETLFKF